jgi:glycosyltransferase involved in cell wall biosynthesis
MAAMKAVVWFPHNPVPPRTGAHQRCLSLLRGLQELGWSSVLLSSELAHNPWTEASVEELKYRLVRDVRLYFLSPREWKLWRLATRGTNFQSKIGRPAIDSWATTPPGYQVWSRRQVEAICPDLMLSSYAQFDRLVPHFDFPEVQSLIDSIDIVTASQSMWAELGPRLSERVPISTQDVPADVLTPAFLRQTSQQVSARELRLYDRYTDVLAISRSEAEIIQRGTQRTKVHYVPMAVDVADVDNTYEGNAVFVGAPNPFNLQGLLWFARHVLPLVRKEQPTFTLDAVGQTFVRWTADDGIVLHGAVHELGPMYRTGAFAICPLLAGTGEQVKIIDAMAHGLAVVATRSSASSSPMVNGVNGYVVDSAAEFAERVIELGSNRELCRKLGGAARETVITERSQERTTRELEQILR